MKIVIIIELNITDMQKSKCQINNDIQIINTQFGYSTKLAALIILKKT